jgi:hypothetical protein
LFCHGQPTISWPKRRLGKIPGIEKEKKKKEKKKKSRAGLNSTAPSSVVGVFYFC